MCSRQGKRGKRQGLECPAMRIQEGHVRGREKLGEEWRIAGGFKPESRGEGKVNLLQSAI